MSQLIESQVERLDVEQPELDVRIGVQRSVLSCRVKSCRVEILSEVLGT